MLLEAIPVRLRIDGIFASTLAEARISAFFFITDVDALV